ncbi:hypothetical protein EJ08DRAFT_648924 [Tothia fuscella]|uniref:N-acetyltransferase domain-containing protein n=1 Tax=Tothia fuscella TaxID=1048955 RepID=A0A9P4NTH1_9PEZI|nr:hypothetical protein EJ08DRAFT_648924 [Tothia fuscella]
MFGTEFVSIQTPPGDSITNYDRSLHYDEQPSSVPAIFTEAMSVREEVFVKEQGVPLENELDQDDARSYHWVVYASVGTTHSSTSTSGSPEAQHRKSAGHSRQSSNDERRRSSGSTASRVPVGTIRLVPPPHKHSASQKSASGLYDGPQWEPKEPYIKLGRLATLSPYRGLGLSKLLVNSAVDWARSHVDEIVTPLSPAEIEAARLEGKKEQEPWEGRVIVHAQTPVQGLWARFGFVLVSEMGTWWEEGLEHVGMQLHVPIPTLKPTLSSGIVPFATPAHGVPDSAY